MNCPYCGQSARYIKQQGKYFCAVCKKFLEPRTAGDVAPMKSRTAAFLIDMVLVWVLSYALGLVVPDFSLGPLLNSTLLTLFLVMGGYFISLHSLRGQTVGKRVLGLAVYFRDESPIPVEVAALRYVLKAISMVLLGIGLVWAFFNSEHRGLHDRFAETIVLEV